MGEELKEIVEKVRSWREKVRELKEELRQHRKIFEGSTPTRRLNDWTDLFSQELADKEKELDALEKELSELVHKSLHEKK